MDVWAGGVIAIAGALIGSVTSAMFQRWHMQRADTLARSEKLRQERVDAYSAYAGALSGYRRSLLHRAETRLSGGTSADDERSARAARDLASTALFRVQLIARSPAVVSAAESSFGAMDDFSKARTHEAVKSVRDRTHGVVPTFLKAARDELEVQIVGAPT